MSDDIDKIVEWTLAGDTTTRPFGWDGLAAGYFYRALTELGYHPPGLPSALDGLRKSRILSKASGFASRGAFHWWGESTRYTRNTSIGNVVLQINDGKNPMVIKTGNFGVKQIGPGVWLDVLPRVFESNTNHKYAGFSYDYCGIVLGLDTETPGW